MRSTNSTAHTGLVGDAEGAARTVGDHHRDGEVGVEHGAEDRAAPRCQHCDATHAPNVAERPPDGPTITLRGRGSLQSESSRDGLVADVPQGGHAPRRKREVCGPQQAQHRREGRRRSPASCSLSSRFFPWYSVDLGPFGSVSRNGSQSPDAFWGADRHPDRDRAGGPRHRREDRRRRLPERLGSVSGASSPRGSVIAFLFILIKVAVQHRLHRNRPLRRAWSRRPAWRSVATSWRRSGATCRARSVARRATPPRRRRRLRPPRELTDQSSDRPRSRAGPVRVSLRAGSGCSRRGGHDRHDGTGTTRTGGPTRLAGGTPAPTGLRARARRRLGGVPGGRGGRLRRRGERRRPDRARGGVHPHPARGGAAPRHARARDRSARPA